MSKYVSPEVVDLIMRIKPTKWKVLKTEAINMNEDFLWFDDTLSWGEEQELKKHNKVSSYVKVNLDKDPDILKEFLDESLSCRGYIVDIFKKSVLWAKCTRFHLIILQVIVLSEQ